MIESRFANIYSPTISIEKYFAIKNTGSSIERVFKIDKTIKGTIALYPTFDNGLSADLVSLGYRFKQVKIEKVET